MISSSLFVILSCFLSECLHLLVVKFSTSVCNSLLDGFTGSFQILSFLELKLSLQTLSFNIRNKEWWYQILNKLFRFILLVLNLVQKLVNVFDF